MKKTFLVKIDQSWTLFLDRDGVVNKKLPNDYVKSWDEFELLPGALEAISILSRCFYRIILVTNQQGIGKGLMTKKDLESIHQKMLDVINLSGGRIDKVYYCPNLVADNSPHRKPNIGMALQAQQDFPKINFKQSIMVGDSFSDIEFGKNAGMKTILISENQTLEIADYTFSSLLDVAKAIEK